MTTAGAAPPTPRRFLPVLLVGILIALQCAQLAPPLLLDGGRIPLPGFAVATASIAVLVLLSAFDRAFRLRQRVGLLAGLISSLALAIVVGTLTGFACIGLARGPALSAVIWLPGASELGPIAVRHIDEASILLGAMSGLTQFGLWAVAVVIPAAVDSERVRRLEIQNLRLEAAELRSKAELVRLRGQLEPHFLLNTLNLVAGLVGVDTDRARSVLVALGDLLEDALAEHADLRSVADEIDWLRRYVEILESRHGDMLRVTWDIDAAARSALVPRLILQPLVENAIQHGALRRRGGGTVRVGVARDGDDVVCTVVDDGPGPGVGKPRPGAVGVENVRSRLAVHFPTAVFDLGACPNGGTRARMQLPFTLDDPTAASKGRAA
jgi:two-component sensor histidine kinase